MVLKGSIQGGFGCPESRSNIAFPEPYMTNLGNPR